MIEKVAVQEMNFPMPDDRPAPRGSTVWCSTAIEELAVSLRFIGAGKEFMTPLQQEVWERFERQTEDFAHDMLLAEGDEAEIARRLGL